MTWDTYENLKIYSLMFDVNLRSGTTSRMDIRDKSCMEDLSHYFVKKLGNSKI